MASVSRTAQFAKVFRVLEKQHYKPVKPNPERPVLEHLMLACCLENAHYDAAEEALAAVIETFFDFNEIRVTTVAELSEVMSGLPNPRAAANRLKRVLQGVFEATYAFDLEAWRKQNLGPTVKWLEKIDGATSFSIAYVVQSALGGHAIPVDRGVLRAMDVLALVSDKDFKAGVVPGLDRAVAKSKGIQFGSLLHQFGADFTANPFSPAVRKILLQIDPDCKPRLPKRRAAKQTRNEQTAEPAERAEAKTSDTTAKAGQTTAEDKSDSQSEGKGRPRKKSAAAKEKPTPEAGKKPGSTGKKAAAAQEKAAVVSRTSPADPKQKKSTSEGLSKRKPR